MARHGKTYTDIKKNTKKKKSRIHPNYSFDEQHLAYADSKGMSHETAKDQFEAFCIHHRKKGTEFVDWHAAWQTWVRNFFKFQKENQKNEPGQLKVINGNPYGD